MCNMDVNFIFKIAAIGIIISVLNTVLVRSGREDQAIAGIVVVLMMIIPQISELFSTVKSLFDL